MVAFGCFLISSVPGVEPKNFGVTFSTKAVEELGLDWQETYLAILEDLEIKNLRIPVYWPEVESEEGVFDFSRVDWMLEEAEKNNVEVILVVGRRLPRWPECHQPEWLENYELRIKNQELLDYINTTIKRYDDSSIVWAWQVENEPFLWFFGECPDLDKEFLDEEIALVRSLTSKPIILTDSGEFGDWFRAYKRADIFGSTLYRTVWRKNTGQITYPLPSAFYRLRLGLMNVFYKEKPVFVCELQAEPWGSKHVAQMSLEEQYQSMSPEKFGEMMEYIKGTGFDTFYLWGVEWWYWLKTEKGEPEMWELVKENIK